MKYWYWCIIKFSSNWRVVSEIRFDTKKEAEFYFNHYLGGKEKYQSMIKRKREKRWSNEKL